MKLGKQMDLVWYKERKADIEILSELNKDELIERFFYKLKENAWSWGIAGFVVGLFVMWLGYSIYVL